METRAKKNDIYLLKGPAEVKVRRGAIEAVGKLVSGGEKIFVPHGKTIPLEAQKKTCFFTTLKASGALKKIKKRTIPASWEKLVNRIAKDKSRMILVLGEVDTREDVDIRFFVESV